MLLTMRNIGAKRECESGAWRDAEPGSVITVWIMPLLRMPVAGSGHDTLSNTGPSSRTWQDDSAL